MQTEEKRREKAPFPYKNVVTVGARWCAVLGAPVEFNDRNGTGGHGHARTPIRRLRKKASFVVLVGV